MTRVYNEFSSYGLFAGGDHSERDCMPVSLKRLDAV